MKRERERRQRARAHTHNALHDCTLGIWSEAVQEDYNFDSARATSWLAGSNVWKFDCVAPMRARVYVYVYVYISQRERKRKELIPISNFLNSIRFDLALAKKKKRKKKTHAHEDMP